MIIGAYDDALFEQKYGHLRILKENEEGYGILKENDAGLISPEFKLNEELLHEMQEGLIDYTKPIIVYATLQKYDVENRNGRIYSEEILRREVTRYQKIIDMNASFHELDHPECVGNQALILTKSGWKEIKDIADNEEILTLNRETNIIEVQKISKKIYQPYGGKMISVVGRNIDLLVTPNHRFWFINKRNGKGCFFTAQDILDNKIPYSEYYVPKQGTWGGENYNFITIEGVKSHKFNKQYPKDLLDLYTDSIDVNALDFFAFMGIYLAEGSCYGTKKTTERTRRAITITQILGEKANQIRLLLNKLPFKWSENYHEPSNKITFICYDARLYQYLKPLGNSYTKYIPSNLKQAAPHLLNILLEWFLMGDGRTRKVKQYEAREIFSTSKQLIDDLHEILIKAGGAGNIHTEMPVDREIINKNGVSRLIKAENSKPIHFLHISTTKGLWFDQRFIEVKEVEYDGYISCVSVPNETFYLQSNGKSFWSGNSSVVSLTKGSPYRILELFWQGNVLIGKLEVLVSRGFREHGGLYCGGDMVAHYLSYGMTMGTSSRGVGTLKTVNGKKMVQPDFELICFDTVSSPSTPGSYIYKNLEDFAKYDEKVIEKPNVMGFNTGSDKKDELMNRLNHFLNPNR
jgi:hypothetical protein